MALSWKPALRKSLGCGSYTRQALTLKDIVSEALGQQWEAALFWRVSGGAGKCRPLS